MKCPHCKDTGVIETGNNDFPCECPAGDTAIFNLGWEKITGKELKERARKLQEARDAALEPGGYLY
jgi:hypothetical protein